MDEFLTWMGRKSGTLSEIQTKAAVREWEKLDKAHKIGWMTASEWRKKWQQASEVNTDLYMRLQAESLAEVSVQQKETPKKPTATKKGGKRKAKDPNAVPTSYTLYMNGINGMRERAREHLIEMIKDEDRLVDDLPEGAAEFFKNDAGLKKYPFPLKNQVISNSWRKFQKDYPKVEEQLKGSFRWDKEKCAYELLNTDEESRANFDIFNSYVFTNSVLLCKEACKSVLSGEAARVAEELKKTAKQKAESPSAPKRPSESKERSKKKQKTKKKSKKSSSSSSSSESSSEGSSGSDGSSSESSSE